MRRTNTIIKRKAGSPPQISNKFHSQDMYRKPVAVQVELKNKLKELKRAEISRLKNKSFVSFENLDEGLDTNRSENS